MLLIESLIAAFEEVDLRVMQRWVAAVVGLSVIRSEEPESQKDGDQHGEFPGENP